MKTLYVGEIGYGNLGDDAAIALLKPYLIGEIEAQPFSGVGGREEPDMLMIGAGTVLDLADSPWMRRLAAISERAKRTVLMCSGLDPGQPWSHEGIALARKIFAHTRPEDRLVRGPISRALLETVGAGNSTVALDPMVLYNPPAREGGGPVLCIPGHQARSSGGPHFCEKMIAIYRTLQREGHRLEFMPVWVRDLDLCFVYAHELSEGQVDYAGCALDSVAVKMSKAKAVISNRMHGALLALVCGTPALFVSHHAKVQDMCLALQWPWYVDAGAEQMEKVCLDFLEALPEPPRDRLVLYRRDLLRALERIRRYGD